MLAARVLIVFQILFSASLVSSQTEDTERMAAAAVTPQAEVSASPAELQRARVLFQRGVQFGEKREFSTTAKRFREALDIHYAPAVEYNLASALFEIGQYPEAYNRAQHVLHHPETSESVMQLAQRLERSLHPYVARLTLVTSGEDNEIAVRVDDLPVEPQLLGVPQAVSPGKHRVLATRGETTISDRDVMIPVRTAAIIDVSVFVTPQEAAASLETSPMQAVPLAPTPVYTEARADGGWQRDWRVWTGIAGGVVPVGVGVTLALTLGSNESSRESPVSSDSEPGVLTW